ncbi:MAG: hypothetical protein WAT19_04120 [Ferruginibacter sp.]
MKRSIFFKSLIGGFIIWVILTVMGFLAFNLPNSGVLLSLTSYVFVPVLVIIGSWAVFPKRVKFCLKTAFIAGLTFMLVKFVLDIIMFGVILKMGPHPLYFISIMFPDIIFEYSLLLLLPALFFYLSSRKVNGRTNYSEKK